MFQYSIITIISVLHLLVVMIVLLVMCVSSTCLPVCLLCSVLYYC